MLIDVTVKDASAQQAQEIARVIGEEFSALVGDFESRGTTQAAPIQVFVAEDATLADSPSSPQTIRNTAVALVLGALAGFGLAIAHVRLDRSVKDAGQAADLAGGHRSSAR